MDTETLLIQIPSWNEENWKGNSNSLNGIEISWFFQVLLYFYPSGGESGGVGESL